MNTTKSDDENQNETRTPEIDGIEADSADTRDDDARDESKPNAENTKEERRPEDIAREPDGSPTDETADNRTELRAKNAGMEPKHARSAAHESTEEDNLKSGRFTETRYPMKDVTGPDLADGTPRMPVRKIDREKVRPDPSLFIETATQMTQEGQNDTRDGNIPYVELADLKARARRLGIEFPDNIGLIALRQKLKAWSAERHEQPKTRPTDDPFADAYEKPMGVADSKREHEQRIETESAS